MGILPNVHWGKPFPLLVLLTAVWYRIAYRILSESLRNQKTAVPVGIIAKKTLQNKGFMRLRPVWLLR